MSAVDRRVSMLLLNKRRDALRCVSPFFMGLQIMRINKSAASRALS